MRYFPVGGTSLRRWAADRIAILPCGHVYVALPPRNSGLPRLMQAASERPPPSSADIEKYMATQRAMPTIQEMPLPYSPRGRSPSSAREPSVHQVTFAVLIDLGRLDRSGLPWCQCFPHRLAEHCPPSLENLPDTCGLMPSDSASRRVRDARPPHSMKDTKCQKIMKLRETSWETQPMPRAGMSCSVRARLLGVSRAAIPSL